MDDRPPASLRIPWQFPKDLSHGLASDSRRIEWFLSVNSVG